MNTTFTKLYQLQTSVCQVVNNTPVQFYLTGGTALARCYLHHRISVDLDFFLNQSGNFQAQADLVLAELNRNYATQVQVKTSDFVSVMVENELEVDFVNDVAHHWGDLRTFPLFQRVDNPLNIMANKLTAILSRDEPKDAVDIVALAITQKIDWAEVFTHANSKAAGILPPLVCQKMEAMPLELLKVILWEENWLDFSTTFAEKRDRVILEMLEIKK